MSDWGDWEKRRFSGNKMKAAPVSFKQLTQVSTDTYGGSASSWDETVRELQGDRAMHVYREIYDNSAVAGAALLAIEMLIRKVNWRVEPGDESADEKKRSEKLAASMDDMSVSWPDTITEILSMLPYGWAMMEQVYKIRKGVDAEDGRFRSRFNDNMLSWRKWVLIPQETRERWEYDDQGSLKSLVQRASGNQSREIFIPMKKSLLFRTKVYRNNPEGRSLLRSAYFSWAFVKRIMEIEGVGIERDLAGVPVAFVPPELLDAANGNESDRALLAAIKKVVVGLRRNSQDGIVFPMAFDDENNPLFDLKLLATGGMRQFDTGKVIERYESRIAMSLLADMIMLGHDGSGSMALANSKDTLLGAFIDGILASVTEVINRHAVPRLYKLNEWPQEHMSRFVPGDLSKADLGALGQYVRNLASVGVITPDPELEDAVREAADLPPVNPEFEIGPARNPELAAVAEAENAERAAAAAEEAAKQPQVDPSKNPGKDPTQKPGASVQGPGAKKPAKKPGKKPAKGKKGIDFTAAEALRQSRLDARNAARTEARRAAKALKAANAE